MSDEPNSPAIYATTDETLAPIVNARFPRFREWLTYKGRAPVPVMRADELADALIEYVEDAVDRVTRR